MATPIYHAGKDGKVKAGATELAIMKWNATDKGNNQDVSNSKDGRKRIGGLGDSDGSLEAYWDSANPMTSLSGPAIRRSSIIALHLISDGSAQEFAVSAIVDEVEVSSEIAGKIEYKIKWSQESGDFTYPS